ncbi:hypothetical protein BD780_002521 [Clostridium tetanomorphum]|uniref:Methionine synthase n=1 Tax=Clostridium tetanomorphum TaxID=1553 RepID=A0A923EA07_CLOTT|nr:hypothetical protein [Clostridium tetanomorphum]KAJ51053.1 hypothetical protein CTM_15018 [Clostridium tetanomorphum DSM 665]MBC2399362.1 methionine synthase [Clostridium tetanomorphum]MBP1865847.1 hypothetical protein [Clostridium tetanomorphum]NRS85296.1 hypothetical protein [Clostridium tetanomorphum]NRZ98475.1 hypothetical protein [Clostridium tetanomorphum]
MEKYSFNISKEEVLRYLGVKGSIEDNITSLIYDCTEELKKIIRFKVTYKVFTMKTEKEEVLLRNCKLKLKGESIINHLKYCNDCVLFAATLGGEVDKKINYYERISMSKAIILDACATVAIEEGCDFVEDEIRKIAIEQGKEITFRFSPGYGDLDLSIQESFIQTVEAYKNIGLTVSAHNILIPRKSVTAIIGFTPKDKKKEKKSCIRCNRYSNCQFKKVGEVCEF